MKLSLNFVPILVCAAGSCWAQAGAVPSSGAASPAVTQAAKELPAPVPPAAEPAGAAGSTSIQPAAVTAQDNDPLPPKRKASADAKPPAGGGADSIASTKTAYVIGPLDVLTVKVWNNPNLSGLVDVSPDGVISMPLIGEVKADGLTARQLKDVLVTRLNDFLNSPEVDVTVAKVNSKRYFVYGGVMHGGEFPLVQATTIMDALSEVGGFRDFSNTKKIYIMRGKQKFTFNYKEVSKGKKMEQNILLQNGDRIFVPD